MTQPIKQPVDPRASLLLSSGKAVFCNFGCKPDNKSQARSALGLKIKIFSRDYPIIIFSREPPKPIQKASSSSTINNGGGVIGKNFTLKSTYDAISNYPRTPLASVEGVAALPDDVLHLLHFQQPPKQEGWWHAQQSLWNGQDCQVGISLQRSRLSGELMALDHFCPCNGQGLLVS